VLSLGQQAAARTGGYFDAYASGPLDPCGLVKGWSIEAASSMLAAAGSPNHCINGGGDIRCAGQPAPGREWRVGIAHPLRPGTLATAVGLAGGAVATSGSAERGHHVLDPRTGRPATTLASVTVVGADLTWADAYATAAFAMGDRARAWLGRLRGHEGLVIYADGSRFQTPGFPARWLG
jgi:thiamine biosynthesis lipoprotein